MRRREAAYANTSMAMTHTPEVPARWLRLVQGAWIAVVLLALGLLAIGTYDKFREPLPSGCGQVECNPIELTEEDLQALVS
jgi:hypothetical protein